MKPSYVVVKTACVNQMYRTPYRVLLTEVQNGEVAAHHDFLINPEDTFANEEYVAVPSEFLSKYPTFPEMWPKIAEVLNKYQWVVPAADGISALSLANALQRYQIATEPYQFITSKTICRRSLSSVLYSLSFLSFFYLQTSFNEMDDKEILEGWTKLTIYCFDRREESSIEDFLAVEKIRPGSISVEGLVKIHYTRKKKYHKATAEALNVEVERDENNPFCDMAVVFTGKLESLTRNEAQNLVLKVGGSTPKGVTMSTDYLVVGEQDLRVVGESGLSGKMKKAQEYHEKGADIEIIGESEFLEMMGM